MPRSTKEMTARERAHPQTMESLSVPIPLSQKKWIAQYGRDTGRSSAAVARIAFAEFMERNGGDA